MTTAATVPASLERRRRLSGLKFTELARLAGITYPRLWRHFNSGGPLAPDEMERLLGVLNAHGEAEAGDSDSTAALAE